MLKREKPARERQIALMVGTEARLDSYAQKWLSNPEVKALLHRYDEANNPGHRNVKRAGSR